MFSLQSHTHAAADISAKSLIIKVLIGFFFQVAALERELAEHKVKYSLLQEQMRLVQAVRDNEDEVKKTIQSSPKCNLKVRKTSWIYISSSIFFIYQTGMDTELLLITQACCVKQNWKALSFVLQTCWLHLVKALQSTLRNGLFEMVVRVVYLFQYFKSSMFGLLGSSLKQVPLISPESFNRQKYCWGIVCR